MRRRKTESDLKVIKKLIDSRIKDKTIISSGVKSYSSFGTTNSSGSTVGGEDSFNFSEFLEITATSGTEVLNAENAAKGFVAATGTLTGDLTILYPAIFDDEWRVISNETSGAFSLFVQFYDGAAAQEILQGEAAIFRDGVLVQVGPGSGSGEANTASNEGTAGVGVFKIKTGVNLEFKNINAGSSSVTITDDVTEDEVDIDVVDATTTLKGKVELATDGENAANVVVQGNDTRLSNARTPTAHNTTHQSGGSDAIKLDDLSAPDDNTDLDVSTSAHGLAPKITGLDGDVLTRSGDGAVWSTPASGGAPTGATYITQTPEAGLSAEQALSALASGVLKNTTATGVLSVSQVATGEIADDAVTFAKMQNITTDRILGRSTAASGEVEELSALPFALTGGDVVAAADSNVLTIDADKVTYEKLQNITGPAVIGREAASSGDAQTLGVNAGSGLQISGGLISVIDGTTAAKGKVELATDGENAAGVVVQGNDARLSDARPHLVAGVAKTSNYTILASEHGTVFTNFGAGANIEGTLPTGVVGMEFTANVVATKIHGLRAPASVGIRYGSYLTSIDAGAIRSDDSGASITLVFDGDNWIVRNIVGEWGIEISSGVFYTARHNISGFILEPNDPWRPNGTLASTLKRSEITTASLAALLTQRMRLDGVWLQEGQTVTNIAYWTGGTAANTPTNWWFALYSYHASAPVLLGQSTDQTTTAIGANAKHQLALGTPVLITATGLYYTAIMVKATTVPTLRGMSSSLQFFNEEAPVRGGLTSDTGLTTTAPDPSGSITTAEEFIPYAQVS